MCRCSRSRTSSYANECPVVPHQLASAKRRVHHGTIVGLPATELSTLKTCLFEEARELKLTHSQDVLVSRRSSALRRPITLAHADDIWVLASSIAKSQPIPRSLLKKGKHNSNHLDVWRNSAKCQSLVQESVSLANDVIYYFPITNSI